MRLNYPPGETMAERIDLIDLQHSTLDGAAEATDRAQEIIDGDPLLRQLADLVGGAASDGLGKHAIAAVVAAVRLGIATYRHLTEQPALEFKCPSCAHDGSPQLSPDVVVADYPTLMLVGSAFVLCVDGKPAPTELGDLNVLELAECSSCTAQYAFGDFIVYDDVDVPGARNE